MPFAFLSYTSPIWYFNLKDAWRSHFPDYNKLADIHKRCLTPDFSYSSESVFLLDAAYESFRKGLIVSDEYCLNTFGTPNLADNYRFVRRHFNVLWSWYILLLRICSLHNPVKEVHAFRSARSSRRIRYNEENLYSSCYRHFESALLKINPKVSVIIPTLNRYDYLANILGDLQKQTYKNFDVIVVDQSMPFQENFYSQFNLDLKLIRQNESLLWKARNTAVESSDNEILLFSEDDVRIRHDWIYHHIKCLDFFDADISSGVFYASKEIKTETDSTFRYADQLAAGNSLIKRSVFRTIGLFDRQFEKQRMGDGEFGLRALLHGFRMISNPLSACADVKASTGGLRQVSSWDSFRPRSMFSPRPVPSVLYFARKYFGNRAAILLIIQNIFPSLIPYRYKGQKIGILLSIPIGLILLPLIVFQVGCSWTRSSKMLRQGPMIEQLRS